MGQEALEAAITFYESDGKIAQPAQKQGRVICTCFNITESEIEHAVIENGLTTIDDVTNFTKAGGGCGGCHGEIQKIIDRVNGKTPSPAIPVSKAKHLTTLQKIDRIREVLARDVGPILAQDGGSCELVDLEGNTAYVKLQGQCSGCAFSNMTLVSVIEKKLHEKISDQLIVKLAE